MSIPQSGVIPFMTFGGNAEEAMNFYVRIFPNSKILSSNKYGENMGGVPGSLINGTFEVRGQRMMVMDIAPEQAPASSWMTSFFLGFETEAEFDHVFEQLAKEGLVMMGPEPIMNLRKVAWITDQFQITWQLVWE